MTLPLFYPSRFLPGLVEKFRLGQTQVAPHLRQSKAGRRIRIDRWTPIQEGHHPAAGNQGPIKIWREGEGEADHFGAADDGIDDEEDDLVGQTLGGDEHAAVE